MLAVLGLTAIAAFVLLRERVSVGMIALVVGLFAAGGWMWDRAEAGDAGLFLAAAGGYAALAMIAVSLVTEEQ